MAFQVEQGVTYQATFELGMIESAVASNAMIADKLKALGFTNVTVYGAGRKRAAVGTWPNASQVFDLPSQITSLSRVASSSPPASGAPPSPGGSFLSFCLATGLGIGAAKILEHLAS